MIVDGILLSRTIADELRRQISAEKRQISLGVIAIGTQAITETYLRRKKKFAEDIGVEFVEVHLARDLGQIEVEKAVREFVDTKQPTGVLIQLPIPSDIDTRSVLNMIPPKRDPDVLSESARELFNQGKGIVPPVIGAIREILERNNVSLKGKKVAVIGEGNLVGKPATTWARQEGGDVTIVTIDTRHPEAILHEMDVIISGAGVPGLIKPSMIKNGVVLLDAGTTDVGGSIKGDADPTCEPQCSLFTPVPGGIGPLTIAMIYKNLLTLSQKS
jgi:methylenetetrahydrofolate dehydrogenase (NADP+)/methenyltetrahydrofolate cyclohydrolase